MTSRYYLRSFGCQMNEHDAERIARREKCFISRREVRVMVKPGEIDDDATSLLAHEIAREIEDQLDYPGQIRVTVIRESRAVDIAK